MKEFYKVLQSYRKISYENPFGTKDRVPTIPMKFIWNGLFHRNFTKRLNFMESILCVTHQIHVFFVQSIQTFSFLCFLNTQDSRCQGIIFLHFFFSCVSRVLHSKEALNQYTMHEKVSILLYGQSDQSGLHIYHPIYSVACESSDFLPPLFSMQVRIHFKAGEFAIVV